MELDLNTLEEVTPRDLEAPICSTDNVWREDDMTRSLTSDLDAIETTLTSCIKSLNKSVNATASNGTFSVTPTVPFVNGSVYLLNLQYSTNSGLVDRSTYAFVYDTSKLIQSTTILANCYNGNDNFMATYRNGTLTFATSYTGSSTPTNLTIKVI